MNQELKPYYNEEKKEIIENCEKCYKPIDSSSLKVIKVPFLNIKKKLYVCAVCETNHYLETE